MIARFDAETLRKMANQLEAYSSLVENGGYRPAPNHPIALDDRLVAYLYWNQDTEQYMAEFISFTPREAVPLYYNQDPDKVSP